MIYIKNVNSYVTHFDYLNRNLLIKYSIHHAKILNSRVNFLKIQTRYMKIVPLLSSNYGIQGFENISTKMESKG